MRACILWFGGRRLCRDSNKKVKPSVWGIRRSTEEASPVHGGEDVTNLSILRIIAEY
jgi:hypothetical protein